MKYNFDFDICAALILAVLLFFTIYKKAYKGSSGRLYLVLLVLSFFNTFVDIWWSYAASYPEIVSNMAQYISSYLYLTVHNMLPFLYIVYLTSLADANDIFFGRKKKKGLLLLLPLFIDAVMFLLNPVFHWVFYFDGKGNYHRGAGMPILFLSAAVYVFMVPGIIYKYKKLLPNAQKYAMYSFIPLIMGAVAIQLFSPRLQMELLGEAVCLLAIFLTLQDPAKRNEMITGLLSAEQYLQKTKCSFFHKKEFAVIAISVINYEKLEDMLGRFRMEQLMKEVAAYLNALVPDDDGLFCTNKKCFQIILTKQRENAAALAEEINQKFKSDWSNDEIAINFRCFISVTLCPEEVTDEVRLLEFAEHAYQHLPNNGEVIHTGELLKKREYFLKEDMARMIKSSLEHGRFEVFYQPIYDMESGKITSAEALVRMIDEKGVIIPPDKFIPIAEENGSIIKIGMFVLEEVCRLLSEGTAQKLGIQYIEVNLSVVQCMQTELAENVLSLINRYGLSTEHINLEITETAAASSQNVLEENVKKMDEAGIAFSLDDYGTGYANIDYITSLPFQIIKIDRSFVCVREEDERRWIAMSYTIRMAEQLGVKVVAEGVDSIQKLDMLRELGCAYAQGFYFSRPVPKEEFLSYVKEFNGGDI